MEKKNLIIIKTKKKKFTEEMGFGYCPSCIAIQLLHCRQLGRLGRAGLGRWARAGRHGRRAWALGVARGACVGARASGSWAQVLGARQAGRWRAARAGARQAGVARGAAAGARGARGRARQQARARAERAGQGQLGGRRAAWALGARPGCLGWPWAVHSVHSAHFRSVLTRFFSLSHQMNTVHCKVKFFRKKK